MHLNTYLKLNGIKRAHFARAIGRSRAAVTRYANGQVPDTQTLRIILEHTLGAVTPNDFFMSTSMIEPPKDRAA